MRQPGGNVTASTKKRRLMIGPTCRPQMVARTNLKAVHKRMWEGSMRRSVHAAAGLAMLVAIAAPAVAAVPNPTVTGPIPVKAPPGDPSHDYPQFATQVDIASQGYVEEEYFFEGTATRYSTPPLT